MTRSVNTEREDAIRMQKQRDQSLIEDLNTQEETYKKSNKGVRYTS